MVDRGIGASVSGTRLPFGSVLAAIGGIYTAQSVVGGVTFQGIPAVLRANGVALDVIGLVSLAMLPWALKFLWAPYLERYRLPRGAKRRSRRIVIVGEGLVAVALVGLALMGAISHVALFVCIGVTAIASATVDIACDGFAIEQLPPESRGWGNTAQVAGGYFGVVLGGGLFPIIVAFAGWMWAGLAMAALIVVLTMPFMATAEPDRVIDHKARRPSLAFALARPAVRWGLVLTVLIEIGVRLAQGVVGPFLIDAGIDLAVLGMLNGIGGAIAGIGGTVVGGALVRWLGPRRALLIGAALQALALATLAAAAMLVADNAPWLVAAVILQTITMAIGFVALYSLLMGLASLSQAGVDFTLFQCADATVAGLFGFGGNFVSQYFGYGNCFALAALLAVAGLAIIPIIVRELPGSGVQC
ncbi:MFS transporter (putative signal transducer) [Rhodopseudomonas faecalis]|uniref:MFS transporter (Putative signal transducer) n=1 Tax=Rhodopseudomonas faecalis TaxID=99655 RepID=A0A318TCE8_9BRAD|nr:MFS transporter [Rhodopseudomonas faecalis]PYF02223.1 MFS transporter (putative signal transducer) [Rhodopseudomonas faecalis]